MLHLLHHCQQLLDAGGQGAGRLADLLEVDVLLRVSGLESLLRVAQGAFHLLQLLGQGFVSFLHLSFNL